MSPEDAARLGALAAGTGVLGIWLVVRRLAARRPSLDDRLAPYLRLGPASPAASEPSSGPLRAVQQLLRPLMADAVRLAERLGSTTADVQSRLVRAGSSTTVEQLRAEQVAAAAIAGAAGLLLGIALVAGRGAHPAAAGVLVLVAAAGGLVARDALLTRQVQRRERRLQAELPAVAELLALAVGAGDGALGALERVVLATRGELSVELGLVLAETRAGTPLTLALERAADRTGLVALARLLESVAVAVDRGTPLADVLRAQAQDVRESGRRELMETGGRREVAMMVPVVFLILPVTVVFALFPGLSALRLDL